MSKEPKARKMVVRLRNLARHPEEATSSSPPVDHSLSNNQHETVSSVEYETWALKSDDDKMIDVQRFFTAKEWEKMGRPQRIRDVNIYENFLCLRSADLPSIEPDFVKNFEKRMRPKVAKSKKAVKKPKNKGPSTAQLRDRERALTEEQKLDRGIGGRRTAGEDRVRYTQFFEHDGSRRERESFVVDDDYSSSGDDSNEEESTDEESNSTSDSDEDFVHTDTNHNERPKRTMYGFRMDESSAPLPKTSRFGRKLRYLKSDDVEDSD